MAIKLGNTTASLYLGSTPVAAYLGGEQVYSAVQAATLYFDGAVDNDWAEVGNWWLDEEHTQAAGRLPTSADSVVATASITASGQTVVDFTFVGFSPGGGFSGTLTVTGMATFTNGSDNDATVNGNATFINSYNLGIVNGNASFEGFGGGNGVPGIINGDATFNEFACNSGVVIGTITGDPPACF
jgi:hypothetical protein